MWFRTVLKYISNVCFNFIIFSLINFIFKSFKIEKYYYEKNKKCFGKSESTKVSRNTPEERPLNDLEKGLEAAIRALEYAVDMFPEFHDCYTALNEPDDAFDNYSMELRLEKKSNKELISCYKKRIKGQKPRPEPQDINLSRRRAENLVKLLPK